MTISSDTTSQVMAFEAGELSYEEMVSLFQNLISSGLVWKLQGFYGRTAEELIAAGTCSSN